MKTLKRYCWSHVSLRVWNKAYAHFNQIDYANKNIRNVVVCFSCPREFVSRNNFVFSDFLLSSEWSISYYINAKRFWRRPTKLNWTIYLLRGFNSSACQLTHTHAFTRRHSIFDKCVYGQFLFCFVFIDILSLSSLIWFQIKINMQNELLNIRGSLLLFIIEIMKSDQNPKSSFFFAKRAAEWSINSSKFITMKKKRKREPIYKRRKIEKTSSSSYDKQQAHARTHQFELIAMRARLRGPTLIKIPYIHL